MQEGLTRNLSAFAKFLQVASFSVGTVLNVSGVAREVMVERKVGESYFEILEDLMLGVRVPVFTKRAKRELVTKSKFYFFDTGVFQSLRPRSVLDTENEVGGAALENLFFQHLLAVIANKTEKFEVNYFRTTSGDEVDFVLHGAHKLLAVEVKNSPRYSSGWLGGLKRFGKDYPEAKRYLLYTGREKLYVNGIEIVPIREFLMELAKLV